MISKLNLYFLTFFLSFLLVSIFFYFIDDKLFFLSDRTSIFLTFSVLSFLLSILGFPLLLILNSRFLMTLNFVVKFIFSILFAILIISVIDQLISLNLSSFYLFLTLIFIGFFLKTNKFNLRIISISKFLSYSVILSSILIICFNHLKKINATENNKKLILFVIDGMPLEFSARFNKKIEENSALDKLFEKGLLFDNVRTNYPYTHGFYKTLYSGDLSNDTNFLSKNNNDEFNLMKLLQKKNIETNITYFHYLSTPQSVGYQNINGLRSALLTEKYSWFPKLLGVQYDIYLSWKNSRKFLNNKIDYVYSKMNPKKFETGSSSEIKVFWNYLHHYLKETLKKSNSSFNIIHLPAIPSLTVHHIEKFGYENRKLSNFYDKAVQNNYRYEDENVMETIRIVYAKQTELNANRLLNLFEALKGYISNESIILFTTDHGSALNDGKIWYGFHPEEEVNRVPLMIFNNEEKNKVINLKLDTIDIRNFILKFFQTDYKNKIEQTFYTINNTKKVIPVLTQSDNIRNERFLILYKDSLKYQVNIHPSGNSEIQVFQINYFDTKLLKNHGIPKEILSTLKFYLDEFEIPKEEINENILNLLI